MAELADKTQIWNCLKIFKNEPKILLLILNTRITCFDVLERLWNNAVLKVCCDGGANRLYEITDDQNRDRFIPDLICGDLDSIEENVKSFYKTQGSQVVLLEDQDNTDFTKSMLYADKHCYNTKIQYDVIVALTGDNSGRLDHIFGNIHTLFVAQTELHKPCYLLTSSDIAFLLSPGKHSICTSTGMEGDYCGLVPVGEKVEKITTTGLKWNLDGQSMSFGGLISTCNSLDRSSQYVFVDTSHTVLWMLNFKTHALSS